MTDVSDKQIVKLINGDIFYVEYLSDTYYDVEDFEYSVQAYVELGKGETIKVLAIFPEFSSISPEAREFLQTRPIPAVAEAVVFNSLAQRLVFRVYQLFRSKIYPVKGFRTKEKALEWLQNY